MTDCRTCYKGTEAGQGKYYCLAVGKGPGRGESRGQFLERIAVKQQACRQHEPRPGVE